MTTITKQAAIEAIEAQKASFASNEYAVGQPLSSFAERFACDQIAAALNALPAVDEWQPIETAPLDWEPILVWAISEDEWEDAQDEERKPVHSAMVAMHSTIQPGKWWLCASSMVVVRNPTHWRPLPKPPQ